MGWLKRLFEQIYLQSNLYIYILFLNCWELLAYPTTAYFQSGLFKNDPYTYTVNEEMVPGIHIFVLLGVCRVLQPYIEWNLGFE